MLTPVSVLLQGILFHDRMADPELKKIKPDLKQLVFRFKKRNPGIEMAK